MRKEIFQYVTPSFKKDFIMTNSQGSLNKTGTGFLIVDHQKTNLIKIFIQMEANMFSIRQVSISWAMCWNVTHKFEPFR